MKYFVDMSPKNACLHYFVQIPNEELLSHLTAKQRQHELQQRERVKFDFEMIYYFFNGKWVQGITIKALTDSMLVRQERT